MFRLLVNPRKQPRSGSEQAVAVRRRRKKAILADIEHEERRERMWNG
ncbi:unnamed protein product [Protopolystoma xenopodis]|uniref:Uncharacterized protein n=1 Tax=Protopolystoma xenopodis TaxID=117903 RepID=A0A3S5FEP4_9PLAT|nr:unnamed protein product [Protopolystoma xenopodis]